MAKTHRVHEHEGEAGVTETHMETVVEATAEAAADAIIEKVEEKLADVAVPAEATTAAPAVTSVKDGAKIMLANGVARIDYIRKRYGEGATRSQITKEINELRVAGTEPVPYQIVFAATKGLPKPTPAVPAAASEATEATPAPVHPAHHEHQTAA